VNRTYLAASAAAALVALVPASAAQAATHHGAALYLAPSSVRPGATFAAIAACSVRGATPTISSSLLSAPVQLDSQVATPFALLDVARNARAHRYTFTLRCVSGRRVSRANATLMVLGRSRHLRAPLWITLTKARAR
jgi:hypothetical protein